MINFLIGLIMGLFLGFFLGAFSLALLVAKDDELYREDLKNESNK